jgi:hypothetical protein
MNDPATAETWGAERKIRADLIRWLCMDSRASDLIDPCGFSILGGAVVDGIELSFIDVPFPIALVRCWLPRDIRLVQMQIPFLSLQGSRTGTLLADRMIVDGDLYLNLGFKAEGAVSLRGGQFRGIVDCRGGTFKNPGDIALSFEGARVERHLILEGGFIAEGEVVLSGARIGADLMCRGGSFRNSGKTALSGDHAVVAGAVLLGSGNVDRSITGFDAIGEVRFDGVEIGGEFNCAGGSFKNP